MIRRLRSTTVLGTALAAVAAILVAVPASAAPSATGAAKSGTAHGQAVFPTEFALPTGFLPEGIAIGSAPYAFFGSRADGDIYRVNLVTGDGSVFSQGPGTPSVGMKVDHRFRLFVAGGPGGDARVVDAVTGEVLASYTFATAPTFVNDVVLTPDAAWFTDSMQPFLYKVPLGRAGSLPDQSDVVKLPLGGDYVHQAGFNLNGIARTPDGDALLVIQSSTGLLFRVDPSTGFATRVDLRRNAAQQRRRLAARRPHALRRPEPAEPRRRRRAQQGGDGRSRNGVPHGSSLRHSDDGRRVRKPAVPAERAVHVTAAADDHLQRGRDPEALKSAMDRIVRDALS